MNLFTHLWRGRSDLPKTSQGFSYDWTHVQLLATRINKVISASQQVNLYVYTNLYDSGKIEVHGSVKVITIPMPQGFFDYERCYGRLLSFKDSKNYEPENPRIFIDLDMVPGPDFSKLQHYKTAFLFQTMMDTKVEQINGGLLIISGGDLDQLSEEFSNNSKNTILKYSGGYVGSDQAVLSGFVYNNNLLHDRISGVELLKNFKFQFKLPANTVVIACSGKRNPFSLRSKLVYPFLNFS